MHVSSYKVVWEFSIVTIVKFYKTPKYRYPVKLDNDNGNKLGQLGILSDRQDIL